MFKTPIAFVGPSNKIIYLINAQNVEHFKQLFLFYVFIIFIHYYIFVVYIF
jgi:hypothetical protein